MSGLTSEAINDVDELFDALDLLEEYGLDSEGVEDIEEAQRRLRKHLLTQQAAESKQKMVASIKHVVEHNQGCKEQLLTYMADIRRLVSSIPENNGHKVCSLWPNVDEELLEHEKDLREDSPAILVAGETGSGKSSLLNLLLGELAEELLPVAHLSSTSVICELRYGDEKKLRAFPRDQNRPPVEADMSDDPKNVLSTYIHQQGDRSGATFQYLKVEVYWPCDWLQGGIAIVDSPGVGEDDDLTNLVKSYIPKASGFIYVINTPNAGGIDPERLQDLILSHMASTKKGKDKTRFNPASAMFICNKWDQIPQGERSHVKEVVTSKLQNMWTGFKPSQLFFLSTKQTLEELRENYISSSYLEVMQGIERLIPMGFKAKMLPHYLFGKRVLERCLFEMRSFLRDKESEAEAASFAEAREKLNSLKQQTDIIVAKLEQQLDIHIQNATKELKKHLEDRETQTNMGMWSRRDCPPVGKDFDRLIRRKQAYANKRIRQEISRWDRSEKKFEGIQQKMVNDCSQHFVNIDRQIHAVESQMSSGGTEVPVMSSVNTSPRQEQSGFANLSVAEKVAIGATAPVWLPLGMVVGLVALPSIGLRKLVQKHMQKKQLELYDNDPGADMEKVTQSTLQQLLTSDRLDKLVQEQFGSLKEMFAQLFKQVPGIIAADEELLIKLGQKVKMQEQIKQQYAELCPQGDSLRNQLDYLYVTSLSDYTMNVGEYTNWQEIGEGNFATVYRANRGKKYVALKAMKKHISLTNVSPFLVEEQNLRALQCDNVVHFFEAIMNIKNEQWFPVFVMEYCDTTLDKVIYSSKYDAPGRVSMADLNQAVAIAAQYAYDICNGLMHIHNMNFLHRDLKPQNILVAEIGRVKIGDLGLAREVSEIKGTVAGTPLYMAPEVWREERYTEKADMFSFGMVMWELWFGCCAVEKFQGFHRNAFFQSAFQSSKGSSPDSVWREIMKSCWQEEAKERPSAEQCKNKIEQQYKVHKPARQVVM